MQNNESKNSNKGSARMWKDRGYYMILTLCILALGVGSYFFVNGALEEEAAVQQTLSVPAKTETPATEQPAPEKTEPAEDTAAQTAAVEEAPLTVLPVSGDVLQDYAMDHLTYHSTTQDWRVHNGVDLAAAVGTEVKAPRAGTVNSVYDDEYYGTTVVISHPDSYTSYCSNLAPEVAVKAGDAVQAGDVIGTVGETALIEAAEASHIHFAVTHEGEPVNPAAFLS